MSLSTVASHLAVEAKAPSPIRSVGASHILAVGTHLKNSVALAVGNQVFLSQHLGDLETEQALQAFRRVIHDFARLYEAPPRLVAADLHPDYLSTRWAEAAGLPVLHVQHHFAHVLSCMAESEINGPVLGVAWDGAGYGPDGTVWGGEFLRVEDHRFDRVAHFRTWRLPGGDKATREPRRSALGLLYELLGESAFQMDDTPGLRESNPSHKLLAKMLTRHVNSPLTSSVGRLFIDEYRDAGVARDYAAAIARVVTRPWTLMEVCGGQTHAIVKFGVDDLLPKHVELVHGPGCPVCVTPVEMIDQATEIAARPEVMFCSFGDMLRVPGTRTDLLTRDCLGRCRAVFGSKLRPTFNFERRKCC